VCVCVCVCACVCVRLPFYATILVQTGLVIVPRTDTTHGLRRFPVFGRRLWNELPHDIRQYNTLSVFKSHLKTFHFHHHMDK